VAYFFFSRLRVEWSLFLRGVSLPEVPLPSDPSQILPPSGGCVFFFQHQSLSSLSHVSTHFLTWRGGPSFLGVHFLERETLSSTLRWTKLLLCYGFLPVSRPSKRFRLMASIRRGLPPKFSYPSCEVALSPLGGKMSDEVAPFPLYGRPPRNPL